MGFETLTLAREDAYAVITLNRPPANAISEQLITEVNAALNAVQTDDSVRAVILTGAGDKIFCGGADLGSAFSGGDIEQFIRFVIDEVMKDPAQVVLRRFVVSLVVDDALKIFIVICKEQIARLVADLGRFLQAGFRGKSFA